MEITAYGPTASHQGGRHRRTPPSEEVALSKQDTLNHYTIHLRSRLKNLRFTVTCERIFAVEDVSHDTKSWTVVTEEEDNEAL